jgi:hypothetical protein
VTKISLEEAKKAGFAVKGDQKPESQPDQEGVERAFMAEGV